jgi:hypothetical protein
MAINTRENVWFIFNTRKGPDENLDKKASVLKFKKRMRNEDWEKVSGHRKEEYP